MFFIIIDFIFFDKCVLIWIIFFIGCFVLIFGMLSDCIILFLYFILFEVFVKIEKFNLFSKILIILKIFVRLFCLNLCINGFVGMVWLILYVSECMVVR